MAVFSHLPTEIRLSIWQLAASNNGQGRVVECIWRTTAYYQRTTRRIETTRHFERAGLRWNYRLMQATPPLGTLLACKESREATLRALPSYLQLNRGPKIRFNPERDMIYFDMLDTFFMHKYCGGMIRRAGNLNNVHGFDEILNLGRPRAFNYQGFQDLRTNARYGPLMPNVQSVVYLHRPWRVVTIEEVDQRIHSICFDVRFRLMVESQRMRAVEDEAILNLQTGSFFHTLVG